MKAEMTNGTVKSRRYGHSRLALMMIFRPAKIHQSMLIALAHLAVEAKTRAIILENDIMFVGAFEHCESRERI